MVLISGCGQSGPTTHPVRGRIEVQDGDAALLTGSNVELMHDTDSSIRPTGRITSSGEFIIETLHQGKILRGAPPGKYKARIILGDESDEGVPKRKGNPVHPRFLDFDKSGLSYSVPGGDITVSLSKK